MDILHLLDRIHNFIAQWEWILLLAVGIIEIIILYKVFQEKKEREVLIDEMKTTRVELGRENYLSMLKETLGNAARRVLFVSHSLTADMTEEEKGEIFKRYKGNVEHKCITSRDHGKIKEMWEQHRRGVEVRVNDVLMRSTFRFQICDGRIAVLGFSEEGDEKSRKGIRIANTFFCRILREHFMNTWEHSQDFFDFVVEVLDDNKSPELPQSMDEIAEEWGLTAEEIETIKGLINRKAGRHGIDSLGRNIESVIIRE